MATKYMLLRWVGFWDIYTEDYGIRSGLSFNTRDAAQEWIDRKAKLEEDEVFFRTRIRIATYEEPAPLEDRPGTGNPPQ